MNLKKALFSTLAFPFASFATTDLKDIKDNTDYTKVCESLRAQASDSIAQLHTLKAFLDSHIKELSVDEFEEAYRLLPVQVGLSPIIDALNTDNGCVALYNSVLFKPNYSKHKCSTSSASDGKLSKKVEITCKPTLYGHDNWLTEKEKIKNTFFAEQINGNWRYVFAEMDIFQEVSNKAKDIMLNYDYKTEKEVE